MDPQIPAFLWDWAKTTGPAGFALIVWWLERRERLEAQKRNDMLVDRLAKVSEDAVVTIKGLRELLTAGRGHSP